MKTYNEDLEKEKRLFALRFRELTGLSENDRVRGVKDKENEIIEKIFGNNDAKDYDTRLSLVRKWKSYTSLTMPSKDNMTKICKAYGVDRSYFYAENTEGFNVTYKEIERITGLSSKSIAVLESIHKRRTLGGRISGPGIEDYSHTTIELINTVLEGCYDTIVKDDTKPVHTVFQDMYNAITFQNLDCSEVDMPVDPFGGKPIRQLFEVEVMPEPAKHIKSVKYTDAASQLGEIIAVRDLFHTFCQNRVIEWIVMQREKNSKRKTASQGVKD